MAGPRPHLRKKSVWVVLSSKKKKKVCAKEADTKVGSSASLTSVLTAPFAAGSVHSPG